MIEKYGKFTASGRDRVPLHRLSRKPQGGGNQGRGARQAESRREGKAEGPAVDNPRVIGAGLATGNTGRANQSPTLAQDGTSSGRDGRNQAALPLTAPARPLTPGEESAKQTFLEMHLAAARTSKQRRAERQRTRHHRPHPSI